MPTQNNEDFKYLELICMMILLCLWTSKRETSSRWQVLALSGQLGHRTISKIDTDNSEVIVAFIY